MPLLKIRANTVFDSLAKWGDKVPESYLEFPKTYSEDLAQLKEIIDDDPDNLGGYGGLVFQIMEMPIGNRQKVYLPVYLAISDSQQDVYNRVGIDYVSPVCPPFDRSWNANGEPTVFIYELDTPLPASIQPPS